MPASKLIPVFYFFPLYMQLMEQNICEFDMSSFFCIVNLLHIDLNLDIAQPNEDSG